MGLQKIFDLLGKADTRLAQGPQGGPHENKFSWGKRDTREGGVGSPPRAHGADSE